MFVYAGCDQHSHPARSRAAFRARLILADDAAHWNATMTGPHYIKQAPSHEPIEMVGGDNQRKTKCELLELSSPAAAITATLFFAQGANADRICKQSCEGGACERD